MTPNSPLPQDLRDLLVRLDQRVSDGFANIDKKLDKMDQRADDHDRRLRDLEQRMSTVETTGKVSFGWGRVVIAMVACSLGGGTIGHFLPLIH